MIKGKKCISPILTTILLLFLSIGAFLILNNWFTNFSSSKIGKLSSHITSNEESKFRLEGISGSEIYIYNNYRAGENIKSLRIAGNYCDINYNLSLGINKVNISLCLSGSYRNVEEVVLVTDSAILSKKLVFQNIS